MKIFVVAILVLIIGSLFSALFFLMKDKSGSARTVRALTLRIGLSVLLFCLLLIAHYFGWIESTGLRY